MSHEGPRGAPPKEDLSVALTELMENLWYAQHQFHEKGDAGREGVRIACHAVARFLAVLHVNPELAVPFLATRAALLDLEKGVTNELLSLHSGDTRRSRSASKKHFQAFASALLEVLVELGDPLDTAAAKVARAANNWAGKGSQIIKGTTVRNWRDEQRAGSSDERQSFEAMRKDLLAQPDPRKEVDRFLREGPPGIAKS